MTDRLLSALREIRAIETSETDLARRLLTIVASATRSSSVTLHRPLAGSVDIRVGRDAGGLDGDLARLAQHFTSRSGGMELVLERPATDPFGDADALTLEVLGGEVSLRIEQHRIAGEASRLRRQIELLRALSGTGEGAPRPLDVADRAATELVGSFNGAHVLVHIVEDDHLALIARRTGDGNALEESPSWIRRLARDGTTAMALAARDRRTVHRLVHDVAPPARAFLEALGLHDVLVVPLSFQEVTLGTLTLTLPRQTPWDVDARRLVESLAEQLSVELAHARLYETERRRADDLGLINELGGLVARHLELRPVLATAATALARAVDVSRVHVFVANDAQTELRGVAATDDGVADLILPLASSHAVAHAFRTLAPVVIDDAETDSRTNKTLVALVGTRSMTIVPLVAAGAAIGVIVLVETRHKRQFTESEVARVVAVANVIAPAVTNAKMFEDLRRSYEALAKAQAELVTHERLAALGELSAVIAHEIRNPVAIIFNSLSELRRRAPSPPEASLLIDIVGEETGRLNRIVGDLLDFVRPYEAHPRPVALDAVVQGAVDAARRAAPEPGVDIVTEVRPTAQTVVLDGTMLQQALLNLVVNAIQATPPGRCVTVRAHLLAPAGDETSETLCCVVADEGRGIDAATSERIFQPFFTTKATGTGLGLAVVRRLTEALGGTIVSAAGTTGGAVFTLTVPLARSED